VIFLLGSAPLCGETAGDSERAAVARDSQGYVKGPCVHLISHHLSYSVLVDVLCRRQCHGRRVRGGGPRQRIAVQMRPIGLFRHMILARAAEQLEALANHAAVAKRHRMGRTFS